MKTPAALLILLLLFVGCLKKAEPEGYRVIGYDAETHQWTILRSGRFDGRYLKKRITAICSLYRWGDHEAVYGPQACHLEVGRMIIPNRFPPPEKHNEFLDVYEM